MNIIRLIVFCWRWSTEPLFRNDENYRYWGVRTSDIPGSNCGCCGRWQEGDPGDPAYPPDWRWTLCSQCVKSSNPDPVVFQQKTEHRHLNVAEATG